MLVSSQPATEEIGAMGRDIEPRQGIGWNENYTKEKGTVVCGIDCYRKVHAFIVKQIARVSVFSANDVC
jgi:hypothetical protein